ncbi:phage tail protein I [Stutzerimonas kunmingensis]|uniref:phage tail protein I n=1 Tax=Stutzerimonas kunmingensis TaxID=1211807 RepID=UPI0028A638FF|nr:phage tail protein I [Stutzerimonas kunmingensis]
MPEQDLLPPNSTALEHQLAQATVSEEGLEQSIRSLYRPKPIALRLLPWLAWSVDVLAWPRGADETTQRRLTAQSWQLHRLQGTLAGYRQLAALTGAEVVKAITPPAKVYTSPALTLAERNAFVSRYPQLRIYRLRTPGQRVGMHCGDTLGRWQPVQSDALQRLLPRAYLYRDGTEAELSVIERHLDTETRTAQAATVTELAVPGRAGRLSFATGHPAHLTVTEAPRRFYRLQLAETYQDSRETLRRVTATPGLTPIDLRPDAVAQPGQAQGVHAGQFVARHLQRTTAGDRLYQRLYLFDPDIDVARRTATLHLDAGRLGMPAHHAELAVRIPGTAHKQTAGRYCRGYLIATDKAPLTNCLTAMRGVMRSAERIAIDTTIRHPITAGESALAGQHRAGSWVAN